jgi:16S rRNA (guanine966-N2)-methyltransferase
MIFDVLKELTKIEGATVLDLCAGSGSLGLECISLGAGFVYFVEENVQTAGNLANTIAKWEVDNAKVLRLNINYLPEARIKADIIFLDPPFGHDCAARIIDRLLKKGWTKEETILVLRVDAEFKSDLKLLQYKKTGISHTYFYKIGEPCPQ